MSLVAQEVSRQQDAARKPRRMGRTAWLHVLSAVIAAALIGSWEVASRMAWISPILFPPPSQVVMHFPAMWHDDLATSVAATLIRYVTALMLGATAGIISGLLIGSSESLRSVVDPFIASIYPVPKIILFPLLIVIFGVSDFSKVIAIALSVFFPTLINSAAGARQISPAHFEVVQSYGGNTWDRFRHVILPGSLPMVLTGFRIAANMGLTVTVSIEFAVEARGIGSVLWMAWQTMRTEELYAGVVIISLIGITVNASVQWVLRTLTPWQPAR